ncbi:urease accessory protein D-like [Orbicella faveolata]|uniref:urease accessory protein D-like n=1 Tax=Orbicella faveolata TaxID=48498 RepID=UPI0009E207C0|nr:urease accessory protein D-like [Orbicella faveolata]
MLSEDGELGVHSGQPNRQKAVKGFAEFCCCPVANNDGEPSQNLKVTNTQLQYTYPLKFLVPGFASSVPTCQWLYIITFGGGLVEGDNVAVDVKVGENCTVVVTTQASTKVYNSEEGLATQQGLRGLVADGGLLAVLPDPVVCFKNAIYDQKQDFELTSNGSVVILDWFTAGRMALGEVWDMTSYKSHNRIFVDGKLVFGDSVCLNGRNSCLSLKESMHSAMVLGSCVFIGPYFKEIKKKIKERVCTLTKCNDMSPARKDVIAYASIIDPTLCDGVVVKLITTQSTEQACHFFRTVIQDIIPRLGGDPLVK